MNSEVRLFWNLESHGGVSLWLPLGQETTSGMAGLGLPVRSSPEEETLVSLVSAVGSHARKGAVAGRIQGRRDRLIQALNHRSELGRDLEYPGCSRRYKEMKQPRKQVLPIVARCLQHNFKVKSGGK